MNNYIVLLCGGNSTRFQENKLLYPLQGKALYRHTFDKLKNIVQRHSDYFLLVVSQYETLIEQV
ncbi:MAG: nucleotidyltransferase family protein, partial [Firmicutes bacterium]|nr:nucleotidyltransferase family protein [Bacillota bacterium]